MVSKVAQSCPTLCHPMDCSLPGSSVHGIFQTRVLEWVAISFSRGSARPRDRTRSPASQTGALPSERPGEPIGIQDIFRYTHLTKFLQSLYSKNCKILMKEIKENLNKLIGIIWPSMGNIVKIPIFLKLISTFNVMSI